MRPEELEIGQIALGRNFWQQLPTDGLNSPLRLLEETRRQ